MNDVDPRFAFLKISEIERLTTKTAQTVYRWINLGQFPKPVPISGQAVAWRLYDYQVWAKDPKGWTPDKAYGAEKTPVPPLPCQPAPDTHPIQNHG